MKIPVITLCLLVLVFPGVSSSQGDAASPASQSASGKSAPLPFLKAYGKKVYGYLTFDDTRWTPSSSGEVPVDSLPWEVLTHATLFAPGGGVPIPNSYANQIPHMTAKAHQHGTYAGLCYGGSSDAALISMVNTPSSWANWINYNLDFVDNYGLDFFEFDFEGSVGESSVYAFFDVFYDSLQTRRSANNPDVAPFIVLTVGPSRAAQWSSLEPFVAIASLMSYDYIGDWWGRIIHDFSPKSYKNWNGTGTNLDYYAPVGNQNAPAPSMQEAAIRVRNAGWPLDKIVVGFDANPTYWYGGSFPNGRGPTYIRQPTNGNTSTMSSNLDFNSQWSTLSQIPADSIHFDQIAQTYWAHTGTSLANDRLWVMGALPGRDSAVWATRQVVDSMNLGGVMFWNLGSEIWNTPTVPPGGRGWFFSQIRKHFSGAGLPPAPVRKIKGEIFFDGNRNNQRDAGERGMAGWKVTLSGPGGAQLMSDSAGNVLFDSMDLGSYTLTVEQKPGWTTQVPSTGSLSVTVDSTTTLVTVRFGLYSASAFDFPVSRSWNIVSVPVRAPDMTVAGVFPLAVTSAYSFHDGYEIVETLLNGEGYWIKFGPGHDVWLNGPRRTSDTIDVGPGWNFVGSVSDPVPVTNLWSIPSGILSPYVYGYGPGSFLAETIEPGKGYWVSVRQAGKIVVSTTPGSGAGQIPFSVSTAARGTLKFIAPDGDVRSLFFGVNETGSGVLLVEGPPAPPLEDFSVTFGGPEDRSVLALLPAAEGAGASIPVIVSGTVRPVSVEWDLPAGFPAAVLSGGGIGQSLAGSGNIRLAGDQDRFTISLAGPGEGTSPRAFRLEQNFPNPFNSRTVVNFSLPAESRVDLEIFNTLGERVASLSNGILPAGSHSVPFEAGDLASGVYFYRLTAVAPDMARFTESKKFLLLR